MDPGEKAVGASTFNYLGKRIHSDSRKDSESSKVQRRKQTPLLNPFLGIWEEHDIVTCDIHEIPDRVHVSRLFIVPKDKKDVRPILDLSEMNTYVMTPKTKMEHLEDTTRLLREPSWAAKIEIEEVPSSVSPRLDKEGPRLARIQDKYQEDFRVSSSVSDFPGAFN